jgi:endogenous inhibitor of DNA gyrase (YacG/DUF329 family)
MPDEDDSEPLHLHEYPDEADTSSIDLTDTVPCPKCRKPVYEGAHHCPGCGTYIAWPDNPDRPAGWGVWVVLLTAAAAAITWLALR